MSTALDRILHYKADEVAALKQARPFAELERDARQAAPPRNFSERMLSIARQGENALICEIKRKSPSAGDIRDLGDPGLAAAAYERGGAACISVLTDGPSFGGSLEDLAQVRRQVEIPVLRKDFMIDVIQVLEARAANADAILIIMAAVDDVLATDLHQAADDLGLSVLLEAHNEAELERALRLPSPLVGVNNRDLKRMVTDLSTTERLAGMIPEDRLLISESGVKTADDIRRLRMCGARGFLVGESLMRAEDTASAVNELVTAG